MKTRLVDIRSWGVSCYELVLCDLGVEFVDYICAYTYSTYCAGYPLIMLSVMNREQTHDVPCYNKSEENQEIVQFLKKIQ